MTAKERQELAQRLREAIEKKGISLNRLAEHSGVHNSQLSRFMRGERDLGLAVADKLCRVLGLELTDQGDVVPLVDRPAEAQDAGKKPRVRAPKK